MSRGVLLNVHTFLPLLQPQRAKKHRRPATKQVACILIVFILIKVVRYKSVYTKWPSK